jgi:hypothetical protein
VRWGRGKHRQVLPGLILAGEAAKLGSLLMQLYVSQYAPLNIRHLAVLPGVRDESPSSLMEWQRCTERDLPSVPPAELAGAAAFLLGASPLGAR